MIILTPAVLSVFYASVLYFKGSGQNSYSVRKLDNPALHSLLLPCRVLTWHLSMGV